MRNFNETPVMNKMQYQGICEITEEFSDLLENMHGRCLNIGCRDGCMMSEIILPKLSNDSVLIGIDTSRETVEHAKKRWINKKRISFLQANIQSTRRMKKEIGTYNNIVSFYYLQCVINVQQTMRNISRLLEPDGQGLLMFISHHDIFDIYMAFRNDPRYENYMKDVFYYFSPYYGCPNAVEMIKQDSEFAGLKIIHCSNREMSVVYQNFQDLQNALMEMDPFLHRMPDEVREEYKDEVTKQYLTNKASLGDKNIELNGCIVDTYRALVIHLQK